MEELYLYFSHPLQYHSIPEKLEILRTIHKDYPGYTIIDPWDIDVKGGLSCVGCMQEVMKKEFFPLIEKSSLFLIWTPIATCNIECELHHAWYLDKICIFVSYFAGEIDFEPLTLEEYHKIESQTPKELVV